VSELIRSLQIKARISYPFVLRNRLEKRNRGKRIGNASTSNAFKWNGSVRGACSVSYLVLRFGCVTRNGHPPFV